MTYSKDFREKILAIKAKEKLSYSKTAKRFGVSKTTLLKWSKGFLPLKKRNKACSKIDMEALKQDIVQYPDSYCYERAARLGATTTCVRDAQYRLGVTYKKNSKASQGGSRTKIYVLPSDKSI